MPDLFLSSSLLPVRHGFSVRHGGVSEGPFDSLNLGYQVGDDPEKVTQNLQRLARKGKVRAQALCTVHQVHGDGILHAAPQPEAEEAEAEAPPPLGDADGLWTEVPELAVGVRTADCVPILLSDPEGTRVAAVHSGWRGTERKIALRAVQTLAAQGSSPASLLAAVGPCIQVCCYEVSEELAGRFSQQFGNEVVQRHGGAPHLDLSLAVRRTLERAGLPPGSIEVLPHCTCCDATRFFSHRRDHGRTGRHLSFIAAGR